MNETTSDIGQVQLRRGTENRPDSGTPSAFQQPNGARYLHRYVEDTGGGVLQGCGTRTPLVAVQLRAVVAAGSVGALARCRSMAR